ncbi:RNA polymerase sigma factor [Paenibacillus beijingensis]|uniref:RNA polymerase subunit sigma-24 n=1 Tax=Paenibacillus beijingensis TaxID=1126833 RepID=A0A0D5NHB7_9BACL|nr:RNA polymerase sigma factor [Paenibacillus beijingensis]AJY74362.1 hypothetical protein VN24_06960 [Paenibacillus beijingensis]
MTETAAGPVNWEFEQLLPALSKYCLVLTGSRWEGEELVQETCLRALSSRQEAGRHVNEEAYLIRTAKNIWIDRYRKERLEQTLLQQLTPPPYAEDEHLVEVETALMRLLSELSPLQRTVVLLRDVLGYRSLEAARMLKTSEGSVKAALNRARAALRTARLPEREADNAAAEGRIDKKLLNDYLAAFRSGDAQRIVELGLNDVIDPVAAAGEVIRRSVWSGSGRKPFPSVISNARCAA